MSGYGLMNLALFVIAIAGILRAGYERRKHHREQAEKRIRTFQRSIE